MVCKYYYRRNENIPCLGGDVVHSSVDLCLLKQQSEQKRVEIYSRLFEKELEGSSIGDNCPVALTDKWKECDYFEA